MTFHNIYYFTFRLIKDYMRIVGENIWNVWNALLMSSKDIYYHYTDNCRTNLYVRDHNREHESVLSHTTYCISRDRQWTDLQGGPVGNLRGV